MADDKQSKLTSWLLSLLSIGFVAWAGVVWSASDRLSDNINVVLLKLASIEANIAHMREEFNDHERLPWHGEVGMELDRLKRYHNER